MGKHHDKKLTVKLIISKKQQQDEEEQDHQQQEEEEQQQQQQSSENKNNDDKNMYSFSIEVETDGKYSRKATYDDLDRFVGKKIRSDELRDWVVEYQTKCFPEDLEEPNHAPTKCFIKDEKNECTVYKDYGWKPVKLNLKPIGTKGIDVKEQYAKQVLLEKLPFDFVKTKDQILEQSECNHEVTSYLKKSKIVGHALGKELMNDDETDIVTELKGGMNSTTFGVFGGEQKISKEDDDDEETTKIWKDTKTLRALLKDVDFPTKKERGNSRDAKYYITAVESFLKLRIYYKAMFVNDVVTIHPDKFRDKPYWKFPIKYLIEYNDDVPDNAILLHEDIELKFYTDITVSMQNKDWIWIKDPDTGNWIKEKTAA